MKRKITTIFAVFACIFGITANAEYNPFNESTIKAVFLGIESGDEEICGYISDAYEKSVDKSEFSALTSKEMYNSLSEITLKNPDVVFVGIKDDDKESAELLIRGILEKDKNTIIVFVAFAGRDNNAIKAVAEAYNTGIIDFDEYVKRRVDAGVLKTEEILSGNALNEKGKEMFSESLEYFYKLRPYKKAVYLEKSLCGKYNDATENKVPKIPVEIPQDSGFSKEEIEELLKGATVSNVYSNTAEVKGERVLVDSKNPLIKPASFGGGISYPVRFLKDYFECKIKYNIKSGEVTITGPENTVTMKFYKNILVSGENQITIKYPPVMYENITYIPEEAVSFITGKSAFSADGIGVICNGQLTDVEKASVIKYLKEGEI